MSKLKALKLENFTLKKARILDSALECEFEESRIVEDEPRIVLHGIKAPYVPHEDLMHFRDELKQYLMQVLCLTDQYDHDIKYLKGEQKKNATEQHKSMCDKIVVTGISFSGDDQLRGVIITGKLKNRTGGYTAINSPRIVFSSEKLGFESKVEDITGLIEIEVYKCVFDGKSAEKDLFDQGVDSSKDEAQAS